jgi:hypothetical protein
MAASMFRGDAAHPGVYPSVPLRRFVSWSAGGPTASFAAVQAVAEYRPAIPAR